MRLPASTFARRRCRLSPTWSRGRVTDPTEIRQRLVEQVTGTVRWRESMAWLGENGVTRLVEIGAGKVLTGLAKRIGAECRRIGRRDAGRGQGVRSRARGVGGEMFTLEGKRALVTGASGGIGGAIAEALHGQGATVTLSGTRDRRAQAL